MPIPETWMVNMDRATRTEYVPGTEEMDPAERYFVSVSLFNLVGRAGYNAALLGDTGNIPLAVLQAGVTGFRLPGKDGKGRDTVFTYSTARANTEVYLSLPDPLANWILNLVGQLNELWPELTDAEAKAAAESLASDRDEIAELQEMAGEEVDAEDPLAGCAGSPASASEDPDATPDASTLSKPPS